MNDSLQELAALYVLDRLDATERTAFEQRLLREPELAAFVRSLEATLAHAVCSLPPQEPPPDLLARVEQRLDAPPAGPAPRPAPMVRFPSPAGFAGFFRWGLAAVVAVSLSILAVQSLRRPTPVLVFVGLDAHRSTLTSLPLTELNKDPDARFIQLATLAAEFWQNPDQLPVKLPAAAHDRRGYALFDPASQQGFIAVEQLPPITPRQSYHLWMLDTATGTILDAGALPIASGGGLYSFSLPSTNASKASGVRFFVTVEGDTAAARPHPRQPRGQVVLGNERI
jgi:hypothetical protein